MGKQAGSQVSDIQVTGYASDASTHLDAIRGLAALTVFLGHGRGLFLKPGIIDATAAQFSSSAKTAPSQGYEGTANQVTLGHEAVMIFFVLSGYLVGGSVLRATRDGYFSWKKYLFQRLTRLWIVLLPALLLGWALDTGGMHLLHSQHNIYSSPPGQEYIPPALSSRLTPAVFVGNALFLQEIVFPLLGTNDSLWSLSYEFWYYILFPFLVTIVLASKRPLERILAGLILIVMIAGLGWDISIYFLIWLFGVGVALLPLRWNPGSRGVVRASAVLLFVAIVVLTRKFPMDRYVCDFTVGMGFSALLWVILHAQHAAVSTHYRTMAQGLSNMSYTLYLVHMPCFAIISAMLMPVWHTWPFSFRAVLMLLAVYGVVFAASWLMYCGFERNTDRIRNWLRKLETARQRTYRKGEVSAV